MVARRRGWPRRRFWTLVTGLGCGWMVLFGPATESCTYVLLAPPLAAALVQDDGRRPEGRYALVGGGLGLIVLASAAAWFPWGKAVGNLGLQPAGAVLCVSWLVGTAVHDLRRRPAKAPPLVLAWRVTSAGPAAKRPEPAAVEMTVGVEESP
jgi:hypothetical protein